jgi:hypothetical protein
MWRIEYSTTCGPRSAPKSVVRAKHAAEGAMTFHMKVLNADIRTQNFQRAWKHGRMVLSTKPEKDQYLFLPIDP